MMNFWGSIMRHCIRALLAALLTLTVWLPAQAQPQTSSGQLVYVPAYSHIYHGDKPNEFLLTITISVRNADPWRPLELTMLEYRGSDGQVLKAFLDKPLSIAPLAATRFVVAESDAHGGSGACFLARWRAGQPINQPVIQAVMIGARANQGISFICQGQPLVEAK